MTDSQALNLRDTVEMIKQQEVAPELVNKVAEGEDIDAVAEVAAETTIDIQERCQERNLSKHAGIAVCYMIVNRLSNPEEYKDE
jgi:hypothetical protein